MILRELNSLLFFKATFNHIGACRKKAWFSQGPISAISVNQGNKEKRETRCFLNKWQ